MLARTPAPEYNLSLMSYRNVDFAKAKQKNEEEGTKMK